MKKNFFVIAIALLFLFTTNDSYAAPIYAVGPYDVGFFGTIDKDTGNTLSQLTSQAFRGLAMSPDGILYCTGSPTDPFFGTIDPSTGTVTKIGGYPTLPYGQLAFSSDGTLYAAGATSNFIATVNPSTGARINTYSTIADIGGLAFDSVGILYAANHFTSFGTINPTTGAFTHITTSSRPIGGLAFDVDGTLYAAGDPSGFWGTIDPGTGVITVINEDVRRFSGIAFERPEPVPEPSITTLFLFGLLGLGTLKRKFQRSF